MVLLDDYFNWEYIGGSGASVYKDKGATIAYNKIFSNIKHPLPKFQANWTKRVNFTDSQSSCLGAGTVLSTDSCQGKWNQLPAFL